MYPFRAAGVMFSSLALPTALRNKRHGSKVARGGSAFVSVNDTLTGKARKMGANWTMSCSIRRRHSARSASGVWLRRSSAKPPVDPDGEVVRLKKQVREIRQEMSHSQIGGRAGRRLAPRHHQDAAPGEHVSRAAAGGGSSCSTRRSATAARGGRSDDGRDHHRHHHRHRHRRGVVAVGHVDSLIRWSPMTAICIIGFTAAAS